MGASQSHELLRISRRRARKAVKIRNMNQGKEGVQWLTW
jgi:hypothetical protein